MPSPMLRHFYLVALLLLLAECGGCATPPYRDRLEAAVAARREPIRREASALSGHDWAGMYHATLVNLDLAPREGFVWGMDSCFGLCDAGTGRVVQADGELLTLQTQWQADPPAPPSIADTLHIVRWGERRYLVPDGVPMVAF